MAHHGSPTAITFQRKIGLASGIGFVVGTIIGSGIFISPRGVFANAGCSYYGAIVVWIICGLYSMIGSIVYSEIGTTILRSGGDYAYIQCGFGSLVSFLYLWLNVVVIRPASHAILALTFAYYLIGAYLDNPADCTGRHVHFELASRLTAAIALSKSFFLSFFEKPANFTVFSFRSPTVGGQLCQRETCDSNSKCLYPAKDSSTDRHYHLGHRSLPLR